MLKFFSNEQNRKALINAYNGLVKARENSVGFTVEDPSISKNPVETPYDIQRMQARYIELQSRIGQKRFGVSSWIGKGNYKVVASMIDGMNRFKKEYEKRTLSRSAYGILAPLAFCTRENLPIIMGNPESEDTFSVTWSVKFRQLGSESPSVGMLEQMGVNKEDMIRWWFEENTDYVEKATDVWDDIKRLALRLVYLFDQVVNSRFRGEFASKIQGLRTSLTRLGTSLARLIYLRHDRTDDICQFFGLFVPVIYRFSLFVRSEQEMHSEARDQCIEFLDIYISALESDRDALVSGLNVVDEMKRYSESDDQTWDRSGLEQRHEFARLASFAKKEVIDTFKSIGLVEISLDLNQDKELGRGSFSEVYACSTHDGSAVRVIREAMRWNGLSHENINLLLGFTVHPELPFPGFVSKIYGSSLHDYIHKANTRISDMNKLVLLAQIAEALRYLHEEKALAHGDLRPSNVLIDSRLTAKLIDFGVSYFEDSVAATTTNQKTNEAFLAPELKLKLEGLRQVSQKGDIYAFGCCFLDVFYVVDVEVGTVEKLKKSAARSGKASKVTVVDREFEPEHWKFLLKTWEDKPDRRPISQELIDAVHDFMD
ncbi:hypothetical protein A7U60_g345 [Sanghuangporus baumii]|uniref:Protein kinase domain-containing protein n=1 Tax=Sanghuangporus baumii TaxID=108892 RepID=A0A9Q5NBX5_SANBA|nr:hypothetical protein A7U60_g345 [Sanghuangporus baumii]